MKLYLVKPEYLFGEGKNEKREMQLAALDKIGVQENESFGGVFCEAEQVIMLLLEGYCGKYPTYIDHISPAYDKKSDFDICSIIESSISSSFAAVSLLFNEKCQQEQPGPSLLSVEETLLLEDGCTDNIQEHLSNGWRILAVCPQPQRRPDYVLGRRALPKAAARS